MDSGRLFADSLAQSSSRRPEQDANSYLPPNISQPKESAELQKLLIDERIRCETHKTNYQTLKEQHKRLQDDHIKIQNELTRFQENKAEADGYLEGLVKDLQAQLAAKSRELEEVRSDTLHPHKLEIIKAEITKELEEPVKAHMLAMDKEVEKYRGEYNKLRYEHTFLKAEYDHAKADHQRNMEEQQLRHKAEIAALKQERDDLVKLQKSTTDVDAQKVIQLQRQKNQLEQRVKNLLDEMNELQKQKELAAVEADSIQRSQAKDLSRLQASITAIESEKRSSDIQSERLQKELRDASSQNLRLNQQIQDLNKECTSLKSSVDEESHRHKVELTNHKLEMLKVKGDMEREKDSLVNKNQSLDAELTIMRATQESHQKEIEELERESSRRVQECREEEWNKNNAMQNEKLHLEEKCRELEQRLSAEKSSRQFDRENHEERLRESEMSDTALRAEISELKVRLQHESQTKEQLQRDQAECSTLRNKLHDRESELQAMTSARQQAVTEAERAKEAIRDVRSDAEAARQQAQRAQSEAEKSVEAHKMVAMEEKHRLQSRIDQLEHKLSKGTENHERATRQQKKMKHMLLDKVRHLKKKVEILEAQKEQLEIEMKVGRHGVSLDDHNRMRRRLRELKRRHNEYRHAIGLGENNAPMFSTFSRDMTSFNVLDVSDLANITKGAEQDNKNKEEIALIQKRLDDIAMQQTEQMEALDAVATTKKKDPHPAYDSSPSKSKHLSVDSRISDKSGSNVKNRSSNESCDCEYEEDFSSVSSSASSKS